MSSTPWLSILIGLTLLGCGESSGRQGTSESATTGDKPRAPKETSLPVINLSTAPPVSLIHQPDSGPPLAGKGGGAAAAAGVGGSGGIGGGAGMAGVAAAGAGGGSPVPSDPDALEPPIDVEPTSEDAGVSSIDAAVEPDPPLPPEAQVEQCGVDESCDLKCTHAACEMNCDQADNCKVDCGEESASCLVSCRGTNNCEPRCRSGSCEIDCTGASHCDHLKCENGAACLARCAGASECRFERCEEPVQCAGNIIVCNRACPAE